MLSLKKIQFCGIPTLRNAVLEENPNLRNAVSHGTMCCSSPPLVTCLQVLVFLYSVFHWRNHQQKRFCRVVTPIAVTPIAVRPIDYANFSPHCEQYLSAFLTLCPQRGQCPWRALRCVSSTKVAVTMPVGMAMMV